MIVIVTCGSLFDGTGSDPKRNMSIVVKDGRIAEILPSNDVARRPDLAGAEIVDAASQWVMPGLINVHDHLVFRDLIGNPMVTMAASQTELTVTAVRNALVALRRGWTTVRDMGASFGISIAFRELLAKGVLPGPRVVACGSPICITGGHANAICAEADGPAAVRKAAREQLRAGADFIKVMASHDPVDIDGPEKTRAEMGLDEIRAAYDEAKAHGKRTAAHVMGTTALSRVLDAGIDVVSHGFYLNDELAQRMAEQGVYYDPTLSSYGRQTVNPKLKRGEKWGASHKVLIPGMEAAFQAALKAGVKIVTGTDSAGRYAEDVAMMREGGLSAKDSLLACTRYAAEALGLGSDVGTIEPGKVADFVVLEGDPLKDAYELERVRLVIQSGRPIDPSSITLESPV